MERTMTRHGVMKVKSSNTTMLLVCGVDGASSVSEATRRMCRAVLDCVQWVLSPQPECEFRAGIHVGPCFGAVMGSRGLTFDVFGDTVNTASRIMSTAPAKAVHMSTVAVDCLGTGSSAGAAVSGPTVDGMSLTSVEAVSMKGKGTLNVFRVEDPIMAAEEWQVGKIN
eukprot:PhM_4_TR10444/c1_g1_i3/m.72544